MAISITRYIDIVSGVGGGANVRERDLILRSFTTNTMLPPHSFMEATSAAEVGSHFGTQSEEFKRATFYFGYISKNISRAQKISFARWVDADVAPMIFGRSADYVLASLKAISSGQMNISIGGVDLSLTNIDFSSATSLADVATVLQTEIRTGVGTVFTAATVVYDAVGKRFNFVGGDVGEAALVVTPGAVNDVVAAVGWSIGSIIADGANEQAAIDAFIESSKSSDNFGSFLFQDALSQEETKEIAAYNNSLNVKFMFSVPTLPIDATAISGELMDTGGVTVTLDPAAEYAEMAPCTEFAATDYSRRNSVVNYMFKEFPLTPSVNDDAMATTYDNLRVNYYGRTQTAGQYISFYQRGVMMGPATAPVDQNIYANEVWLKSKVTADIMSLLLSVGRVPANRSGEAMIRGVIEASAVEQALYNGTISLEKTFNQIQKIYITEVTGDPDAWQEVQARGYWLDVKMQSIVTLDGRTEWIAVYILVYSKDDAVRKVNGTHILI